MTGQLPDYRAVVKIANKRWDEIGAAWSKGENISVQLKFAPLPVEGKINFLLVPNGAATQSTE